MKTGLMLVVLLLLVCLTAAAQPPRPLDERKEEIEAMKIGFMTRKLGLSPEEAQQFWPLYNAMEAELEQARKAQRADMRPRNLDVDRMSDAELTQFADDVIAFRQKEVDILNAYHQKYKQVLSPRKLALYYMAEHEFKRNLLNQLQGRPAHR